MSTIGRRAVKRPANRKTIGKVPNGLTIPVPATASGARWHLPRSSQYQQTICELELQLSQLRTQLDSLQSKTAALEAARNHYRSHFNGAPVGFVLLDDLGKVLELNETFGQMVALKRPAGRELFFGRFLAPGYL